MAKKEKQFFVLEYDFNKRDIDKYDVMPYFRAEWKAHQFDQKEVKTREDLKVWIKRASSYQFWSRCEYEFLMLPWPVNEEKWSNEAKKIDVHQQLMYNIEVLTDIMSEEFNIPRKEKSPLKK